MATCTFENFDITIYGEQIPYFATFEYRGQSAEGTFAQDITLPVWENFGLGVETGPGPAAPSIAQLGGDLFDALVQADLRDLWVAARLELDRGIVPGLRMRLMLRPPAVAALPWEILRDSDRRRTFAADSHTPLVRMETQQRYITPARPLSASLPLKMLLVLPTDPSGQIDSNAEEQAIRQALDGLADGQIELSTVTGAFDILDLRKAIETNQPDLIHIVTHGMAEGLLLWRDGEPAVVSPASLRTALDLTDSVKLIVINACRSAQDPARMPLASLGAQMLQTGVPAVVAMQYDIQDRAAIHFSRLLYTSLMGGRCAGRVDVAVGYARSGLYALDTEDISFGTPVLWLNSPDGVIFETGGWTGSGVNGRGGDNRPADPKPVDSDIADPETLDKDAVDTEKATAWASALAAQRAPAQFSGDLKYLAQQITRLLAEYLAQVDLLSGLYESRLQGNAVSAQIERMEAHLVENERTVQRLDDLIQSIIDQAN